MEYLIDKKEGGHGSVSLTKGDRLTLSGGRKGLFHFTCNVYDHPFPIFLLIVFCLCFLYFFLFFFFLQGDNPKSDLSKCQLNIGLSGRREKPKSYLIPSTGIINTVCCRGERWVSTPVVPLQANSNCTFAKQAA